MYILFYLYNRFQGLFKYNYTIINRIDYFQLLLKKKF